MKSLKWTYVRNEKIIPYTERNKLLNVLTVPNTSVNEFVNLLQQQTIMNRLKPAILSESSVGAPSGCVRSRRVTFMAASLLTWKTNFVEVLTEMSPYQPLLMDNLLSVSVSANKIISNSNENFFLSLVPKLTLIYSILLATRFPDLSRMQKVISSKLIDENVLQEVIRNTFLKLRFLCFSSYIILFYFVSCSKSWKIQR